MKTVTMNEPSRLAGQISRLVQGREDICKYFVSVVDCISCLVFLILIEERTDFFKFFIYVSIFQF